jgi:uncharacterized protein (TIGR02147 family)
MANQSDEFLWKNDRIMEPIPFYQERLLSGLEQKKLQNPSYSLRAFARDLDIDFSLLSKVLKGKRPLSFSTASLAVKLLKLDPKEKTLFMESICQTRSSLDDIKIAPAGSYVMLDESHFKAIAEWEHYAVLSLFDLEGFKPSVVSVSNYLGTTLERADDVIKTLLNCGLLAFDTDFNLIKSVPVVRTTEDTKSRALFESHLETLELGKKKLQEIEVDFRDFSSTTLAIDLEKLPEAKGIIREFRQKMMALLKTGQKKEIYQLAIQFYPLTNLKREQSK